MGQALFADVVVNGEAVPFKDVAAEAQNHTGPRGVPGTAWRKAADAIAIRTLLLQEAKRQGIDVKPQVIAAGKVESDEEAVLRQLLEGAIDVVPPSRDAVRQEWAKDPSRFKSLPLWDVSHILIGCDPEDVKGCEKALERAVAIHGIIRDDPKSFRSLAESESDCSSKTTGGYLGQLRPGDSAPEFEAALASMDTEGLSPTPVKTEYGYHIIRMEEIAEGRVLPFEAVADKISDAMEKAAWARAAREYVGRLLDDAEISGASLSPR